MTLGGAGMTKEANGNDGWGGGHDEGGKRLLILKRQDAGVPERLFAQVRP